MALTELEYDHNMFEKQYGGDEKLVVYFFSEVLPDPEASAETGMKKFRDADMIHIQTPGDRLNIVIREARDDDKERFAAQFKKYKADADDQLTGYPLKEWPLATRAMAEELKHIGFRTVEQVAAANDQACSRYPGLRELSKRATAWLQAQNDAAPLEKLAEEVKKRDELLAAQAAQLAEMAAMLKSLKSAAPAPAPAPAPAAEVTKK